MHHLVSEVDRDRLKLDTIVIPAHDEGFKNVFMAQQQWFPVLPIHADMIDRLRYIAVYRVAPKSAITHYARITSIEPLPGGKNLIVKFTKPRAIGPLRYHKHGEVKPIQGRRYAEVRKLRKASSLDDAF